MLYCNNFVEYINLSTNIKQKLARIDAVIDALESTELTAAGSADIEEYRLDDGQTIIKTIFKSSDSIEKYISALEKRKTRILNRAYGHRYNLQDGNVNSIN